MAIEGRVLRIEGHSSDIEPCAVLIEEPTPAPERQAMVIERCKTGMGGPTWTAKHAHCRLRGTVRPSKGTKRQSKHAHCF